MTRFEFKPGIKFKHRGIAHRDSNPREAIFIYRHSSHDRIELVYGDYYCPGVSNSWMITITKTGFYVEQMAGYIFLKSKLIKFQNLELITEPVTNQIPHNGQDNHSRLSHSAESSHKI